MHLQTFSTVAEAERFLIGLRKILPKGYKIQAETVSGVGCSISVIGRAPKNVVSPAVIPLLNAYREGFFTGGPNLAIAAQLMDAGTPCEGCSCKEEIEEVL